MRPALLVLFVCGIAPAAPVKPDPKAERAKLEALWRSFHTGDPLGVAKAALMLKDHPDAVPFLREKLRPVTATEQQIKTWLTALNSDRDDEWKPAYEELRYFDPRLVLTVADHLELLKTDHARCRYFALWCCAEPTQIEYHPVFRLAVQKVDAGGTHLLFTKAFEQSEYTMEPVAKLVKQEWQAVGLAVVALERTGTPDAVAVLKQLADGHPDILPTKDAAAALKRLAK